MQPYWDAQNAGGRLIIIRAASGLFGEERYIDNATLQMMQNLQLDFEELPALRGDCRQSAFDEDVCFVQILQAAPSSQCLHSQPVVVLDDPRL